MVGLVELEGTLDEWKEATRGVTELGVGLAFDREQAEMFLAAQLMKLYEATSSGNFEPLRDTFSQPMVVKLANVNSANRSLDREVPRPSKVLALPVGSYWQGTLAFVKLKLTVEYPGPDGRAFVSRQWWTLSCPLVQLKALEGPCPTCSAPVRASFAVCPFCKGLLVTGDGSSRWVVFDIDEGL